jgi:hypothetical protein
MKLRKQAPAKAFVLALCAALLAGFYALVRAEPRLAAEEPRTAPVDYDRFFAPSAAPSTSQPVREIPDARTRAS